MAFVSKLAWYWKRARVMSKREVLHRAGRLLDGQVLYFHWRFGRGVCRTTKIDPGQFQFCSSTTPQLPQLEWRMPDDWQERSSARLNGEAAALGFDWRWTDAREIWRKAPENDNIWPDSFYGKIDYRPGNRHGDVRVLWEPARLQYLVDLALIARDGPEESAQRAVDRIETHLVSWCRNNPPLSGPHYASVMECALRIVAVCHAVDLVRNRLSPDSPVWGLLPSLVSIHANLIARRLSLYSSLGNHTIAECVGLIYASVLFPEMNDASRWRKLGRRWLDSELDRQILEDGGGIEQAFWYHLFVVDLAGLAQRLFAHRGPDGRDNLDTLKAAVERGRSFLALWADSPASLPDVGDKDGGFALSPYLAISWPKSPPARRGHDAITLPQSGYTRLRLRSEAGNYLLIDHGPLGMAPGYGHGHADALSLIAVINDQMVLIDPGTYGYGLGEEWRRFFRGTAAHNTVSLNGRDQAIQESRFQWKNPGTSELISVDKDAGGSTRLLARFAGNAPAGWVHWRGIYCIRETGFVVWDHVVSPGGQTIEARWHTGCSVQLGEKPGRHSILVEGTATVSVEITGGDSAVLCGADKPIAGWAAHQYGALAPISTICAARDLAGSGSLATRIRLDGVFGSLEGEGAALKEFEARSRCG